MSYPVHSVMASSFADPKDVAEFKKWFTIYKNRGLSDHDATNLAYGKGDNGVGCWGDDTTSEIPMCALPPEDWHTFKHPHGQKILVTLHGTGVICKLMDTMPHKENITNHAGIDLNPGAQKAFGLRPPFLLPATWQVVA